MTTTACQRALLLQAQMHDAQKHINMNADDAASSCFKLHASGGRNPPPRVNDSRAAARAAAAGRPPGPCSLAIETENSDSNRKLNLILCGAE